MKVYWDKICKLDEDIDKIINEVESLCSEKKENITKFMDCVALGRKYQRALDDICGHVGLKLGYIDAIVMPEDSGDEEDEDIIIPSL